MAPGRYGYGTLDEMTPEQAFALGLISFKELQVVKQAIEEKGSGVYLREALRLTG